MPITATVRRCEHWIGDQHRYCHATDRIRAYLPGDRCPAHTPAAIAGHPEPDTIPRTPQQPRATQPGSPRRLATTDVDRLPILGAALDYARRGWPVFLLSRSKRPVANCPNCPKDDPSHDREGCTCLTCHGFYAATRDPDRIAAMLDRHPRGCLAIRTGAASGLVVADIDPRNGGAIDRALMVPTATVASGGGGWHLFYAHPGGHIPSDDLRPGIDIKADGGYVVAPPSIHPGTKARYQWVGDRPVVEMPRALADTYQAARARRAPTSPLPAEIDQPRVRSARGISHPDALLNAHLAAVDRAPEGSRRVTLYGAARGVARMVDADAITATDAVTALTRAGRHAEQSDRDIRAAIVGAFRAEHVPVPSILIGVAA